VLTQPTNPKAVDWDGLEAIRKRAEALGDGITETAWRGLFTEAKKIAGNAALEVLSLYGRPEWLVPG
jgi:hypothetical protein